MNFNRVDAKMRAKASTRGAIPHPALVTLVYVLLTSVLIGVIMAFVGNPFQIAALYLMEGNYPPEMILYSVFTPGRVALYLALNILLSLYACVMSFGYTSYGLRLSRWERPGFRNLLDGFSLLGRVIGMNILIAVFTCLWTMLAMIPYMAAVVLGTITASSALVFLAGILAIAGMIFGIAVTYRYRLAFYFLLDNPFDVGALECIRRSKQTMKGRKWTLFVMDLSFLGWIILVALTIGILGLWVSPYMAAAEANFYNWAAYGTFPEPPAPPVNHPVF